MHLLPVLRMDHFVPCLVRARKRARRYSVKAAHLLIPAHAILGEIVDPYAHSPCAGCKGQAIGDFFKFAIRPAIEYLRHPGFPLAVVVDGAVHGGEAHFFASETAYRRVGQSAPTQHCWLPQIVYRLYSKTPSVMLGHVLRGNRADDNGVAFRSLSFGLPAPLVERGTST